MLTARELSVSGSTLTHHPLHLLEADITGTLDCDGAHLDGTDTDRDALVAANWVPHRRRRTRREASTREANCDGSMIGRPLHGIRVFPERSPGSTV
jgi:hypothetical protein